MLKYVLSDIPLYFEYIYILSLFLTNFKMIVILLIHNFFFLISFKIIILTNSNLTE